jgi:hypothetical protein
VKGIKATTISILAIGLLAGAAGGAAAQDEETAESATPVYITFTVGEPASVIDGTWDESAGELRGAVWEGIPVEASDPRVSGLASVVFNGNREIGSDTVAILESRSYRIDNDGGAWVGQGTYIEGGDPSADQAAFSREAAVLVGEGDYEGLTLVSTADYREANSGEGVIYGIAVPPAPDVPSE